MTVFGPDVSKWQEGLVPPDPHGIGFGIARATNGQAVDPTCVRVIKWCRDHKVPFAAYHFVYEISSHSAAAQANAFSSAVGGDKSITCMLDWEKDDDDNCHPGRPQVPKWNDVLAVAEAIRKLGYKVPLLYANYYYWKDTCGSPTLTGQGFDLVNAKYGNNNAVATPQASYAAQGGDAGPGWTGYGGLTPVLWQFGDHITWGNKNLDMNAYRGDPAVLNKWFTIWKETTVATYPYAYGSTMLTMEQMEAKTTVKKLNPEFWRRYKALIEFAASCGVKLGVGTGWRVQPNPPPSGFAPPGNSNHEGFPADGVTGGAVAIDTVPSASWAWMEMHLKAYGLRSFKYINNEPWHIQPAEIPAGRSYRKEPWKLATFALPTQPSTPKPPTTTPPPTTTDWSVSLCNSLPTLKKGAQGIQVKRMQHFLAYAGTMSPTNMANFDGVFGSGTESSLNRFLATGNKPQNGTCDDMVWNWFMATGDGVPTLKKGATGGDVTRMQRMLAANGYMDPANQTNFDGQFGSGTESALKRFQSAKGLAADGICGQNSWTKLLK